MTDWLNYNRTGAVFFLFLARFSGEQEKPVAAASLGVERAQLEHQTLMCDLTKRANAPSNPQHICAFHSYNTGVETKYSNTSQKDVVVVSNCGLRQL